MYTEEVIITIHDNLDDDKSYVFHEPERCLIGRADDCDIQVPSDDLRMDVSRHHCLLEIIPPRIFVGDLGSRNGTFVNGVRLGRSGPKQSLRDSDDPISTRTPVAELKDGDHVQLGKSGLSLAVEIRAYAAQMA